MAGAGAASRRRGRQRELSYVQKLTDEGWVAYRVDGAGDIVAGRAGYTMLIQCKSTRHPYDHFLPADRARLSEEARRSGWRAFLLWWPKGTGVSKAQLIPECDWP